MLRLRLCLLSARRSASKELGKADCTSSATAGDASCSTRAETTAEMPQPGGRVLESVVSTVDSHPSSPTQGRSQCHPLSRLAKGINRASVGYQ